MKSNLFTCVCVAEFKRGESDGVYSIGSLSEMAEEAVRTIDVDPAQEIQLLVRVCECTVFMIMYIRYFYHRVVMFMQ